MTSHFRFRVSVLLLALLFVVVENSIAQERFVPLKIQKAYQNQTRSMDGQPGSAYWQNIADYIIEASIDTISETLSGNALITYYNNSPDTLKNIVFRLYQDFFRRGNARQWPVPDADLTEGVQIKKLKIDKQDYDPNSIGNAWRMTNYDVPLKQIISPGTKCKIEIEWSFTIPTEQGLRMRKYADDRYFIAYWYPQIAVYDDIDGWDRVEYLGAVEFYNDINNFDVKVKLPSGYIVWATGELQNMKTMLKPEIVKRYRQALQSDEVIKIITQKDYEQNNVLLTPKTPVWHFKASGVPDFAFAVSAHSNWDGVSLSVNPESGERVLASAVYPDGSEHWEQAAEVSKASIEYLSHNLPGVPFPYPHMTSFCNGRKRGGMETPMMANNGTPSEFSDFLELTFHEITHSYFPFFMGTNERKYAWMDEGWAAYLPTELSMKMTSGGDYLAYLVKRYEGFAGEESELPLMVPSYQANDYTSMRQAAYNKPAMAYHFLRDALGDSLFKKGLKEYIERWKGKHPIPFDFFNSFETATGEYLDWFWNPWFFERGYPDLGIKSLSETNELLVERIGHLPVPLSITYTLANGKQNKVYQSTKVWQDDKALLSIQLPSKAEIVKIELGNAHIPDMDRSNNLWLISDKK